MIDKDGIFKKKIMHKQSMGLNILLNVSLIWVVSWGCGIIEMQMYLYMCIDMCVCVYIYSG